MIGQSDFTYVKCVDSVFDRELVGGEGPDLAQSVHDSGQGIVSRGVVVLRDRRRHFVEFSI